MSWLERLRRPSKPQPQRPQTTTIVLDLHDEYPLIFNLQGVWLSAPLHRVLASLLQEHWHPEQSHSHGEFEVVWQDGDKVWGDEIPWCIRVVDG